MDVSLPHVSVVICCYSQQRWADIQAAIASAHQQTRSPLEVIVVVDHNAALRDRLVASRAPARIIENHHRAGLSGARNTGVEAARGEIVAFLDDDAVAHGDWLERLCQPYGDKRVLGVGGQVVPRWTTKKPGWFPDEFGWVVGCSYVGLPAHTKPLRNVIGANMSFRREAIVDLGGFDDTVGRVESQPLGCEETDLCIRAQQRWPDALILYRPSSIVSHKVTAERAKWSYFANRCFAEGISKARVTANVGSADGLSSERAYVSSTLPRGVLACISSAAGGDPMAIPRAAAIVAGVAITGAGYVLGVLRTGRSGALATWLPAEGTDVTHGSHHITDARPVEARADG